MNTDFPIKVSKAFMRDFKGKLILFFKAEKDIERYCLVEIEEKTVKVSNSYSKPDCKIYDREAWLYALEKAQNGDNRKAYNFAFWIQSSNEPGPIEFMNGRVLL